MTYNSNNQLSRVTNTFGRSLFFTYGLQGQLSSVVTPDGRTITYGYDAASRLASVSYADGSVRRYQYEDPRHPLALTSITDEIGIRYATFAYDSQGRAVTTTHAAGALNYSVKYEESESASGSLQDGITIDAGTYFKTAQVTDPLGSMQTYTWKGGDGKTLLAAASGAFGGGTIATRAFVTGATLPESETDFLGISTMYTWDINRRLPLTTTKAAGLPEVQTTTTQWHSTFRLPVLVTEAGKTTAYTYDGQGNLLTRSVTDTNTSVTRTTSWTYNTQGQVATVTPPTGIVASTYAYYADTSFSGTAPTEVGHTVGDLRSITNAAGHVTQYTQYDRAGRVRQMINPKGVVTDTVYTPRGWINSTTVTPPGGTARTTTYSYDNAGQLTGVVLPDATSLSYSYDAAHRLVGVTDAKGNSVAYTLDNMGNRVSEQVKDAQGNLQRSISRVYDALNRVQQVTGAAN